MSNLYVNKLIAERDALVLRLWNTFNKLSFYINIDDWTDADLELWTKVTSHTAIQNKLDGKKDL